VTSACPCTTPSQPIEGFTAFICFATAHEVIRQGRRDLTLVRLTPDVIYDQMVASGCARRLVFSYLGNPGLGSLHCIRRAVEAQIPHRLELEEYSPVESPFGDGAIAVVPPLRPDLVILHAQRRDRPGDDVHRGRPGHRHDRGAALVTARSP
jgi:glutaconate CoA-transferase subunit A